MLKIIVRRRSRMNSTDGIDVAAACHICQSVDWKLLKNSERNYNEDLGERKKWILAF